MLFKKSFEDGAQTTHERKCTASTIYYVFKKRFKKNVLGKKFFKKTFFKKRFEKHGLQTNYVRAVDAPSMSLSTHLPIKALEGNGTVTEVFFKTFFKKSVF